MYSPVFEVLLLENWPCASRIFAHNQASRMFYRHRFATSRTWFPLILVPFPWGLTIISKCTFQIMYALLCNLRRGYNAIPAVVSLVFLLHFSTWNIKNLLFFKINFVGTVVEKTTDSQRTFPRGNFNLCESLNEKNIVSGLIYI